MNAEASRRIELEDQLTRGGLTTDQMAELSYLRLTSPGYKLWVDNSVYQCVRVLVWDNGAVSVSLRDDEDCPWDPPIWMTGETTT